MTLLEIIEIAADTLRNLALIGATAFVITYGVFFKWWVRTAGQAIIGFTSGIVALTFLNFLDTTFGDNLAYESLRLIVMGGIFVASWGLLLTLFRKQPEELERELFLTTQKEKKRMTTNDRILATIRTFTPAVVGAFLAWLVGKIPAVADWLTSIDAVLAQADFAGATAEGILTALAIGGFTALYYWLVRVLSPRWPWLEALLGSKKTPVFLKPDEGEKVER